jgi:hypothetical protein
MATFQKQTLRDLPEIGKFIHSFVDNINSIQKFIVTLSSCTNHINQTIQIKLNDSLPELKLIDELTDVKNGYIIFQGKMNFGIEFIQEVSHEIEMYLNYNRTSSEFNVDYNEIETGMLSENVNQYCIVKALDQNTQFLIKIL